MTSSKLQSKTESLGQTAHDVPSNLKCLLAVALYKNSAQAWNNWPLPHCGRHLQRTYIPGLLFIPLYLECMLATLKTKQAHSPTKDELKWDQSRQTNSLSNGHRRPRGTSPNRSESHCGQLTKRWMGACYSKCSPMLVNWTGFKLNVVIMILGHFLIQQTTSCLFPVSIKTWVKASNDGSFVEFQVKKRITSKS